MAAFVVIGRVHLYRVVSWSRASMIDTICCAHVIKGDPDLLLDLEERILLVSGRHHPAWSIKETEINESATSEVCNSTGQGTEFMLQPR